MQAIKKNETQKAPPPIQILSVYPMQAFQFQPGQVALAHAEPNVVLERFYAALTKYITEKMEVGLFCLS